MSSNSEFILYSATEQARLLARGEVSCAELTNLYLERIAKFGAKLGAFTYVAPRRARWAARQWDRAHRQNKTVSSPLSGIATGVKDLALVRGMPTRFGSRSIPPIAAVADSLVAKRMRRAGMIITSKLATSEFGAMPVTEPDTHPPARNAFDHSVSPGGSSGGSGSAVAAGLLPIAQGSDGAGSIRIPCSLGHLVGLKPTRGQCSYVTPVDRDLRLSAVGGLATTVEDLAAFTDVLSDWAHDFHGHYHRDIPTGLRVKISTESPLSATEPEYQQAAERVASILEDLGSVVEPAPWIDLELKEFLLLWRRLMSNAPMIMESRLQPITAWLRTAGRGISKQNSVDTRIRLGHQILEWFGDTDLWISPTVAIKAPPIGCWRGCNPEAGFAKVLGLGVYTAAFNVSGQPAISVPMGLCSKGLPIGVQIAGRIGCDDLLLRVAHAIEMACGGFRGEGAIAAFC